MKTMHTPGNWEVKDCHDDTRTAEIKADDKNIATVWAYNNGSKVIDFNEQQANAKLMAAAPELLRMLKVWKKCIDIIVSSPEAMDKERLKVYQSLQESETYKQTLSAIKQAAN